jgi:hypothetical protein
MRPEAQPIQDFSEMFRWFVHKGSIYRHFPLVFYFGTPFPILEF